MKSSPAHFFRWAITSLVSLFIVIEVVTAIGIYAFSWHGPRTTSWTRFVPVPVANYRWHLISAHTWLEQFQAITHYNDYLSATNPTVFSPHTTSQNLHSAMTKVVRDAALSKILADNGIRISSSDIDQAFQSQLTQTGKPDQIAQTLRQYYNWSPEQFKQSVITTVVERDKLQEKLSFDSTLNASARQQADRVSALVKAGKQSFEDLAKSYSDDAYGVQGGDLGFVPRGVEAKEIDDAAFALPVGTVSDILHTKFGFHIIKIVERKTIDGQDEVHLKQIFISAPPVDQYITAQMKKANVWVWLPGLRWDANAGQTAGS